MTITRHFTPTDRCPRFGLVRVRHKALGRTIISRGYSLPMWTFSKYYDDGVIDIGFRCFIQLDRLWGAPNLKTVYGAALYVPESHRGQKTQYSYILIVRQYLTNKILIDT